jgi:hypothetical protein
MLRRPVESKGVSGHGTTTIFGARVRCAGTRWSVYPGKFDSEHLTSRVIHGMIGVFRGAAGNLFSMGKFRCYGTAICLVLRNKKIFFNRPKPEIGRYEGSITRAVAC